MKLITITGVLCLSSLISTHTLAKCDPQIVKNTPTADFTVQKAGTVTHKRTGLMWKVCTQGQIWQTSTEGIEGEEGEEGTGQCVAGEQVGKYNWQQALAIPDSVNTTGGYATYTDWRLPNINELFSIVENACLNNAINETIFNNILTMNYWSSSPDAYTDSNAWTVRYKLGYISSESRTNTDYHVRLVRDAP
jgi:hypothetical protein